MQHSIKTHLKKKNCMILTRECLLYINKTQNENHLHFGFCIAAIYHFTGCLVSGEMAYRFEYCVCRRGNCGVECCHGRKWSSRFLIVLYDDFWFCRWQLDCCKPVKQPRADKFSFNEYLVKQNKNAFMKLFVLLII